MRTAFLVPALLAVACGVDVASAPPSSLRRAIGEPTGTFPSPEERLGVMAINRARSDPATLKGPQSASYPARPPIQWSYDLSRSSRFHAVNLQLSMVTLMHTSPCPLAANVATSGCDGNPACACASPVPAACAACASVAAINSCGTDTFARIGYFTAGTSVSASGEVGSAGYPDPIAVVDGWVDEPAGADGHRQNLLDISTSSNVMGFGHAPGSGCWPVFDFSDSGNDGSAPPVRLPTAAVSPGGGAAGTFTFYATWADPAGGAPASISVVLDGACATMTRELGSDTLNATYKLDAQLATGCHTYWILARDPSGGRETYPTGGAITISVGGAGCGGGYVAQAPPASCEGSVLPPDMTQGGPPPDLLGAPPEDLTANARDAATDARHDGGLVFHHGGASGCGCAVAARDDSRSSTVLCLALALLATIARRRRGAATA